ncbi:MAG: hypothetical protein ACK4S0_01475 [Sediminibacterium sp.]
MKKRCNTRFVKPIENYNVCQQSEQIGQFAEKLNRLPDASAVKKAKLRSVPVNQLPLIF